ncbi:flagellar basal body P-ring formation chaperone FlgA [Herbaspirillum sp. WGmk3]|uniref:flagellar basal body P-ring formation chaperone FlgA n=1 Tax=Herbaspirillum sp. WGmk3 TaxID=2919925 RepID=UPI002090FDBC|nr:flagellar basal body P-ring formation chaperone FlgA [Herbaspirillum sp. WGmk3]MCO4855939.1 flagellar basal body P-ring formation chaperone FlgA [Herbaspirillum sp. WGmk3]
MNIILRHSLGVALLFSGAVYAGQLVEISLRSNVQVRHSQVLLGDIADMRSADTTLLSQLREIPLGSLPRTGLAILNRSEIERWIRTRTGSQKPDMHWAGAERVEVVAQSQRINGSQLADAAHLALENWLSGRSERSEIELLSVPADFSVPMGMARIVVRDPGDAQPYSRMALWTDVYVDDLFVRSVPVRFRVRAYRTAYVARQDIGVGRAANETQFESRQVDIAPVNGAAIPTRSSSTEPETQWRVKKAVGRGDVLVKKQVDAAPMMQRGQIATLRAGAGDLTIEGVVEVLQDGYLGQLIRVKGAASTGVVMARVVGPGSLEMTER